DLDGSLSNRGPDGRIGCNLWSAATCRRFRSDAKAIAAALQKGCDCSSAVDQSGLRRLPLLIAPAEAVACMRRASGGRREVVPDENAKNFSRDGPRNLAGMAGRESRVRKRGMARLA